MKGQVWRWGAWFRVRDYGLNVHLRGEHGHLYATRGLWHRAGPLCWRFLTPTS